MPAKSAFAVVSLATFAQFLHGAPESFHRILFIFTYAFLADTFFGLVVAAMHKQWKSRRQRVMSADKMVGYMIGVSFGLMPTILTGTWWPVEAVITVLIANEAKSLLESFDAISKVYDFGRIGALIHALATMLDAPEPTETHKRVEMSAIWDNDADSPSVSTMAIEQTTTTRPDEAGKGGETRSRTVPINTAP